MDGSQPLDPRKTIFVGGVPRPLRAGLLFFTLCLFMMTYICLAETDKYYILISNYHYPEKEKALILESQLITIDLMMLQADGNDAQNHALASRHKHIIICFFLFFS